MIREIIVIGVLVMILLGLNVAWQRVRCGTPVCMANPVQIIPCESGEKLAEEMYELKRRARENPAR